MHNNFHPEQGTITHDIEYYGEHGVPENPKVMFGVIKWKSLIL